MHNGEPGCIHCQKCKSLRHALTKIRNYLLGLASLFIVVLVDEIHNHTQSSSNDSKPLWPCAPIVQHNMHYCCYLSYFFRCIF